MMNKISLLFLALLFIFSPIMAREGDVDTSYFDDINSSYEDNLDSLLNLWYVQNSPSVNDFYENVEALSSDSLFNNTPDSVYIQRLAQIPTQIKLTYNPIVRRYIEVYTQKKKDRVQVMLGLSDYYFPIFDDIFDYYGVPNEMKYMSIIESALYPHARSRTRAIGLWQFMYGTGKLYGLNVNGLVDERCDPLKATHAAARFSRDLYKIFHDWKLVVAAYNCGPGNVHKAIRRSGGKRDFWEIYRYLPRETRGHVPAFIAAIYTFNYYKEHNIKALPITFPVSSDTLLVSKNLHLMQVAEMLNQPIELLRDMNPQYLRDIIPARDGIQYPLRLPSEVIGKFIDLEQQIYAYKDTVFFNPNDIQKMVSTGSGPGSRPKGNYSAIKHVVKAGETLGGIAHKFNCSLNEIKDWNNIYRNRIRIGQKLTIYVSKKKAAKINKEQAATNATNENTNAENGVNKVTYHKVSSGDTLWDVAQAYGVKLSDLCKWNNITPESKLMAGSKIKICFM